jgi:hypothetical protein
MSGEWGEEKINVVEKACMSIHLSCIAMNMYSKKIELEIFLFLFPPIPPIQYCMELKI